jgi:hypothetical protein
MTGNLTHDVTIDMGERFIVLGPFTDKRADEVKGRLHRAMVNTAHPDKCDVRVSVHDAEGETATHDDLSPDRYRNITELADQAAKEEGGGKNFPDVYTRLQLALGYQADGIWNQVLDELSARDAAAYREQQMDELTAALPKLVAEALSFATRADLAIAQLVSDQIFDEDFFCEAADGRAELEAACRHLRNANRIADARRAQYEQEKANG